MKLNKRGLAAAIGVTEETITQWMKQGCPVDSKARGTKGNVYDLAAVFAWRVGKAERRHDDDAASGDLTEERTRLTKLQADKVALELAELRGEYVRFPDVIEAWGQYVGAMRARMLAIPAKASPRIAAPGLVSECQALLRDFVDEALNELAGDGLPSRARARAAAHAPVHEGADAADGKPVGRRRKDVEPGKQRRARKVGNGKG